MASIVAKKKKKLPAAKRKKTVAARGGKPAQVRMLLTCAGRRVELINAFRRAAERAKIELTIFGSDVTRFAPAMHRVDKGILVQPIREGRYIDELIEVVRKNKIDLLVPTIDTELPLLAAAVERFAEVGCRAVISSARVVSICRDKLETFRVLSAAGVDVPHTQTWSDALATSDHQYPLFMKPRFGSAGVGSSVINDRAELETLGRRVGEPIVQEFVAGVEHTMDVYTGLDGMPRCVVPRRRLEVRTGEVSKGLVVKNPEVMAIGQQVAEVLGECRGVVTVQCMVQADGRIRAIEINPRFGGGVPLAIHAGADFPRWLLLEHLGRKVRINPTGFADDMLMLRYDESVFVPKASRLRAERPKT